MSIGLRLHDHRNRKILQHGQGFGFITPDDGTKDVFVHISAVEGSDLGHLADGQKVSFDIQQDTRGPKAVNLQDA